MQFLLYYYTIYIGTRMCAAQCLLMRVIKYLFQKCENRVLQAELYYLFVFDVYGKLKSDETHT